MSHYLEKINAVQLIKSRRGEYSLVLFCSVLSRKHLVHQALGILLAKIVSLHMLPLSPVENVLTVVAFA